MTRTIQRRYKLRVARIYIDTRVASAHSPPATRARASEIDVFIVSVTPAINELSRARSARELKRRPRPRERERERERESV